MQHIRSSDGTSIAYEKTGEGPPLIIIGGSLGDHRFYVPLAGELARRFTVYTFDRRGRGQSTDTQPYAVERELEDVAALVARPLSRRSSTATRRARHSLCTRLQRA